MKLLIKTNPYHILIALSMCIWGDIYIPLVSQRSTQNVWITKLVRLKPNCYCKFHPHKDRIIIVSAISGNVLIHIYLKEMCSQWLFWSSETSDITIYYICDTWRKYYLVMSSLTADFIFYDTASLLLLCNIICNQNDIKISFNCTKVIISKFNET